MITIIPSGRNDLLEIEVTGNITKEDMKEFERAFHDKKTPGQEMNLLMIVNDIDVSMKTLKEDFKFDKEHMDEFNKVAVVSDKKWIEMGSKLENLMPGMEVKHFDKDHRTDAVTWIH